MNEAFLFGRARWYNNNNNNNNSDPTTQSQTRVRPVKGTHTETCDPTEYIPSGIKPGKDLKH